MTDQQLDSLKQLINDHDKRLKRLEAFFIPQPPRNKQKKKNERVAYLEKLIENTPRRNASVMQRRS